MSLGVHTDRTERSILPADARVVAIVGNYGSGKTEIAVNLALQLAASGHRVQIADLDLVNPYFRCREAAELMEAHGIRVVVPPGSQVFADLPIILPEIRGMLHPPDGVVTILDVGGDDVGARALASFRTSIADGEYELWQVINSKRPFTDTVEGCMEMRRAVEASSRWTVTGLLVNSHLMDETTIETVMDGWRLADAVRARTGLPIRGLAAMRHLADAPALLAIDAPILPLRRHMLPPWLQHTAGGGHGADARAAAPGPVSLPAARPVPLGTPRPITFAPSVPREGDSRGPNRD